MGPETTVAPGDYFLQNLVVFARLLRSFGIPVSAEQVSDFARMLDLMGLRARDDFDHAARAVFVRRREDLDLFDRALALFFQIRGKPSQSAIAPTQAPSHRAFRPRNVSQMLEREWKRGEREQDRPNGDSRQTDQVMAYSPLEILRQKEFDQFSEEQVRAARRLIATMDWQVGTRKTRRHRPVQQGTQIHFARLLRNNLKYGTELFRLPEREPRIKPRPLVVLADISGSMERYTRMILHLLHTLYHERGPVEVFVFGTRLTRTTPRLKRRQVDQALAGVAEHVSDWSGGTRIGECIRTFNFKWARRVLRSGAVVLIVSDGWDRGDLELLRDEMARLRRSTSRLIWLSPLAGQPGATATQGMQVVLPFVDDLLPIYNLASLEMLVDKLSTLTGDKPLRRQRPQVTLPAAASAAPQKPAGLPHMGTSDYVRRTMTLRTVDGATRLQYEANSDAP
ncbi:MAG: vWA domain-containing protein [Acidobacteriota bacterium]